MNKLRSKSTIVISNKQTSRLKIFGFDRDNKAIRNETCIDNRTFSSIMNDD